MKNPSSSTTSFARGVRLRRLRKSAATRALFSETRIDVSQLVQAYFVVPGSKVKNEVKPGFGLWQVSADVLVEESRMLADKGIGGIMLFGVPDSKGNTPDEIAKSTEETTRAISVLKSALPSLPLFVDVCLCGYAKHGHCGLVSKDVILNDETLPVLARMSTDFGRAGADFVCPSDMMDGRIQHIRQTLDAASLTNVSILSYAVKMASAFYAPFRDAAHSAPQQGDRSSYQQPISNRREALRELAQDEEEGADALLIKPALSNLDLIRDARERTALPIFAYQVSGEYATLVATAQAGLLDLDRAVNETLTSIRRAGADVVVTYAARGLCLKK